MESRTKLFGHAIHPILIVFPLGLLPIAVVFDGIYLATGDPMFAAVAFWNVSAGILGGLAAAAAGVWDWLAVPKGTRARAVGLWHAAANSAVLVLFAAAWLLRWNEPFYAISVPGFLIELVAVGLAAIGGWLGGELVERLRVGVDDNAHLNAPNSLSRERVTR